MDENKNINLDEEMESEKTNQSVSLEEMAEIQMNKTEVEIEDTIEEEIEPEVECVDENEVENTIQEAPLVLDADITSEEEIPVDNQEEIDAINKEIQKTYAKYKRTMFVLVACFAIYLVFMFMVKKPWSMYVVLADCVALIALAVYDTRLTRRIRKLATERGRLMEEAKIANGEPVTTDLQTVENAQSLNDLPRQFTVLDDIEFEDGMVANHIVVSPYGIAVVGSEDLKDNVVRSVAECGIYNPEEIMTFYDPEDEVSTLVQNILKVNVNCLDERQIMNILLNLTGIRK